jgi:Tfp pilus assembly protein PilF
MSKAMRRKILLCVICVCFCAACAGKQQYVPTKQAVGSGEKDARVFTDVPQSARNHHNLAMNCFNRQELPCAARHWREAEKAASRNSEFQYEVNYNLGVTFQRMNKHILAEKHFKKSIMLTPDDAKSRAALGQTYVTQDRFSEALAIFSEALKFDSKNSAVYLGLADMYMKHEKFLEAVDAFRAAAANKPDYQEIKNALRQAYTALGGSELFKGNLDWAQELFSMALALDPQDSKAKLGLGHTMLRRGYPGKAKPYYREAFEITPDYKPTVYELMGKKAASEDLVAAVRAQSLGEYYLERGQYKSAVEQMELTLSLDPNNTESWTRLGEIYMDHLNDVQKSCDSLHALWAMNVDSDRVQRLALKIGHTSPGLPDPAAPEVVFVIAGTGFYSGRSELANTANSFEVGSSIFRQIRLKGMAGNHVVEKSLIGPGGKAVRDESFKIDSVVDEISLTSMDTLVQKGGYQQRWIIDGNQVGKLNFDLR